MAALVIARPETAPRVATMRPRGDAAFDAEVALRTCRAILGISATVMASACLDLRGACVNERLSEMPSPDGARRAVVFQRDCGATTASSTHVSVLSGSDPLPDSGGNVFAADTDHGRAPQRAGGGPRVSVRWLTADTLEIRYDSRARHFVREEHGAGATVRFVADSRTQP